MEVPDVPLQSLSDDALVMLDPAVEILKTEDEFSLLCQTDLEVGMVVPPGEGLLDFVRSLMGKPARVGALREEYDDRKLIDEMLSSLLAHGFARVMPHEGPPAARALRRAVVIDLDAIATIEELCALWSAGETAPEVLLRCLRLSDHNATLRELAHRRAAGTLRAHHVVVRASDVRCDGDVREFVVRLGAAVEIDGVEWPAPHGSIPGLAELTRALIATHVIMAPDASILDESIRERCVAWCRSEFVSGLCLRLDPSTIAEEECAGVLDAVRALEIVLGDVVVTNMPGDEVLLGNTDRGWLSAETSDAGRRFRLAYLRWRIPLIKAFEGDCPWSQIPEVEDQWVRSAEDLLPNHPELLLLAPGSSIVDVCGGMGRVARRLAPAVGPDGVVISIELRRFLTERARRFAYEGTFTNLQFRPGRAEQLPLPDCAVDAAVNEWTGAIWELELGPTMVKEMARVVRPGGRIAVTHRLVQLRLDALDKPWVQYEQIYQWVRDAFRHPELTIVAERVWGQTVPSKGGQNATLWVEQYMPRLVDPNDRILPHEDSDRGSALADVYLTMIAERRKS
jgi:ubiquinone/menaquinone biosynthesis C-methylase UbiE